MAEKRAQRKRGKTVRRSPRPKIFVSHSSVDGWVARQIAGHIQNTGAECFLDVIDVEVGEDFEERIRDAMEDCLELLVLFTPSAIKSRYVWVEIGAAWGQRKRIVGVLYGVTVKDIQKNPAIPLMLKRAILVEINDLDQFFRELRRRVRRAKKTDG